MSLSVPAGILSCLAAALLGTAGCGGGAKYSGSDAEAPRVQREGQGQGPAAGKAGAAAVPPTDAQRKIIYTAQVEVVVRELDAAFAEVNRLVEQSKGYFAASDVRGNTGTVRSGTYTIRVPVEQFPKLKEALLALGAAERNTVKTDDVTEEFVDVQARIKNLKQEEEALNRLMKEKAADVKDVVEIRKQIQPVRQDIDRAEARLNYLNTFAALSTIELTLREIKDYKPPTAPTLGDRIGRTLRRVEGRPAGVRRDAPADRRGPGAVAARIGADGPGRRLAAAAHGRGREAPDPPDRPTGERTDAAESMKELVLQPLGRPLLTEPEA